MASTNRSRRGHLSSKIPNVKLRPASSRPNNAIAETSRTSKGKARERAASPDNLMDQEMIRRLYKEDEGEERDGDSELNPASFNASSSMLPFRDYTLCFTGLQDRKSGLIKILRDMGVKQVEPHLTVDVDVLIADDFGSPKYLSAIEHGIPVVTPEWITSNHHIWRSGEDIDVRRSIDEYRLLPFRGLKLAISSVEPVSRRNEVQNFILSLGGVYSKNLDRTCTHLIVARPSSPCTDFTPSAKVSWALSIKPVLYTGGIQDAAPTDYIHVVWEGWFWDCVEFRGRWLEERWDLRNGGLGPSEEEGMRAKAKAKAEAEAAAKAEEAARVAAMYEESLAAGLNVKPVDPLASAADDEVLQQAIIRKGGPSNSAAKLGGRVGGLVDDLISSVVGAKTAPSSAQRASSEMESAAIGDGEYGAAIVEDGASPDTSRKRARLALVGSQQVAPRISMLHNSRIRAFETLANIAAMQSNADALDKAEERKNVVDFRHQAGKQDQPFHGLVFSHVISEKPLVLEEALRKGGARLVKEDARLAGEHVDFIVTRLAGGLRPSLPSRSSTQIVTECWVEQCIYGQRLCPIEDSIVFRPLAQPMPIAGTENMYIHLSGLTDEMIYYTKRLIKAIGAHVATALSRKSSTHLVCGNVNALKFEKAMLWEIPVVKLDWLYDMASKGSLEPMDEYLISPEAATKLAYQGTTPANAADKVRLSSSKTSTPAEVSQRQSALGNHQSAPGLLEDNQAEPAEEAPMKPQVGFQPLRNLGLTPTAVDVLEPLRNTGAEAAEEPTSESQALSLAGPATERRLNIAQESARNSSASVSSASVVGKSLSVPPPANPFKVPQLPRKSMDAIIPNIKVASSAVGLITSELMQKLEEADQQPEERRARGTRRPRLNATRKHSAGRTRSILAPTESDEQQPGLAQFNAFEPSSDRDVPNDAYDEADQSIRVRYNDPVADRERKRLLDALTRTESSGSSTRSKRAKRL